MTGGLRFLLDECSRSDALWQALLSAGLDVERVGDDESLPLESDDSQVIARAAERDRILFTRDASTIPGHLAAYVEEHESPGVICLPAGVSIGEIVEILSLVAHCTDPFEWQNACRWLPR